MKIAIVGSRQQGKDAPTGYDNAVKSAILNLVYMLPKDTIIVSGGATGADFWAEQAAKIYRLPKPIIFYPEWKKYGYGAGKIRNVQIVKEADLVIAFWNGVSKGTEHSIETARYLNKPVVTFIGVNYG